MLQFGNKVGPGILATAVVFVMCSSAVAAEPEPVPLDGAAVATEAARRMGTETSTASLSPSGVPAPLGGIDSWRQVFVDDFDVDVPLGEFPGRVGSSWGAYLAPWRDTSRVGMYDAGRVVSVSGGVLRKHLHTEGGQPLVAALQPKLADGIGTNGMLYGRYEIRARFDRLPGYRVGWRLWPSAGSSYWPEHGEIVWPEADLDQTRVMGLVRHWGATSGSDRTYARVDTDLQAWHTYTIEWSPGADGQGLIVLYFDGTEVLRVTERVPQEAMRWILQTETSRTVRPAAQTAGMVEIDWVAAWAYDPGASPSGVPAPRGDINSWEQVFVDDFDVDVPLGEFPGRVGSSWGAYPAPWRDTSRVGMYDPGRVVSVSGGVLRKHLHTEGGQALVAALQPKLADGIGTNGMLYGRYEVRARFDRLPGYKVAWLLWPSAGNSYWPEHGEIDWPEADLDQTRVMGFVHHWGATSGSDQSYARVDTDLQAWHTYTIEWSPGADGRGLIVFYFDGTEVLRLTQRVPQEAMRWVIQTETSLTARPAAQTAGMVEIDWVAAWAYNP